MKILRSQAQWQSVSPATAVHRGSQLSGQKLVCLASEARVANMLSKSRNCECSRR